VSLENCPQCGEPYTIHSTGGCPRMRSGDAPRAEPSTKAVQAAYDAIPWRQQESGPFKVPRLLFGHVEAALRAAYAVDRASAPDWLRTAASDETGWVIERGSPPVYWGGLYSAPYLESCWSTMHQDAVRFARYQDAYMVAHWLGVKDTSRVVEHRWAALGSAPPASEGPWELMTNEIQGRLLYDSANELFLPCGHLTDDECVAVRDALNRVGSAPRGERCLLHRDTEICSNGVCHRCKSQCDHSAPRETPEEP